MGFSTRDWGKYLDFLSRGPGLKAGISAGPWFKRPFPFNFYTAVIGAVIGSSFYYCGFLIS